MCRSAWFTVQFKASASLSRSSLAVGHWDLNVLLSSRLCLPLVVSVLTPSALEQFCCSLRICLELSCFLGRLTFSSLYNVLHPCNICHLKVRFVWLEYSRPSSLLSTVCREYLLSSFFFQPLFDLLSKAGVFQLAHTWYIFSKYTLPVSHF